MIEKYDLSGGFVTIKDEPTYKWVERGVEGMKLFEVKLEDDSVYVYVVAGDISKVKSIIDCKYRMSNIERIQHIKGEVIIEGV